MMTQKKKIKRPVISVLCLLLIMGLCLAAMPLPLVAQVPDEGELAVVTVGADPAPASATLRGELISLGESSSVQVCFEWGETTDYGNTTTPQEMTTAGFFNDDIDGLTTHTTYHYRAVAQAGETVVRGEDRTVTTFAVNTLDAANITDASATLNGFLVDLNYLEPNVPVSFEWGTDASYGQTTEPVLSGGGPYSTDIQGLTPETVYHFRAKAEMFGDIYYGLDKQFTTTSVPVYEPPEVVTHYARNITETSVSFKGELIDLGSASTVSCSFAWGTTPGGPYPNSTTPEQLTEAGNYAFHMNKLTPGTRYYYKAKADGDGIKYGVEQTFRTLPLEKIPPAVTTENASNIKSDSARLKGKLTDLGSADEAFVSFEYGEGTDETAGESTGRVKMTGAGEFSTTVTNLTPGKTYWFRAKAAGDADAFGEKKTFTTPQSSSGGGGGGGGGDSSSSSKKHTLKFDGFVSTADLTVDVSGKVKSSVQLKTGDGKVILDIAQGTVLKDASGAALKTISASPASSPPDPPAGNDILIQYDFGPDGAVFIPNLTLTFNYGPADLPEGAVEEGISIAYWNGSQWVTLPGQIDSEANSISAKIAHFSQYALMAALPPAETEAVSAAPGTTESGPAETAADTPAVIQSVESNEGSDSSASVDVTGQAPLSASGSEQPDNRSAPLFVWALVAVGAAAVIALISLLFIRRKGASYRH